MADLDTIDGELDELRAVPDNLDELIARYGERDRSLERIDDVLNALAAGTRPRTVPPLGATPSEPSVMMAPASVRPEARMSSRPPRVSSRPPGRASSHPAPAPTAAVDYEMLFGGPETVPPEATNPSVGPVLALEFDADEGLSSSAQHDAAAPPVEAGGVEPAHDPPLPDRAAEATEIDAVLAEAPAEAAGDADADADADDGFEMMVEEDDILEIDSDDLEMVEDP